MRPHDDLCASKAPIEIRSQRIECLRHMAIAQVPGVHTALKHRAVILFSVLDQPCVLFRGEELILGDLPVPMHILVGSPLQILKLLHHIFLTGLREIESGGIAVGLLVLAKMIEAGVAITGPPGSFGIDFVQISNHFAARVIQAI